MLLSESEVKFESYPIGTKGVATRQAGGAMVRELGKDPLVYVDSPDLSKSAGFGHFIKEFPERKCWNLQ